MHANKYGGITFTSKKELSEYFTKMIEPDFNNRIEEEVKKYNATLEESILKGIKEAKEHEMKRAITLLFPVMTTSLYEALHLNEEKQKKVIQRLAEIMQECTEENIFEWDEYREFCEKKGKRYFEMEVQQ